MIQVLTDAPTVITLKAPSTVIVHGYGFKSGHGSPFKAQVSAVELFGYAAAIRATANILDGRDTTRKDFRLHAGIALWPLAEVLVKVHVSGECAVRGLNILVSYSS